MDFDGFDQTQAITLDDYSDDTDDLGDPEDRQAAGFLKVFSQKSFNETSFPIYEGDNFIGRHETNQICIPLKALSRKHACIEIQGDSHLIYDLDSRNKTRRGKLFLKPSVRYEIQDSDSVVFGDIQCEYTKAEVCKKPTILAADSDSDNGSDTGSESMLLDTQPTRDNISKEHNLRSSTSQDIIEPTQRHGKAKGTCTNETTVVLETPQREGGTLILPTASDEIDPNKSSVKAPADSSISPGSIAETPTAKPIAESTVINQSEFEDAARSKSLDSDIIDEPAAAPTQVYAHFAEMETQPYLAKAESDEDSDEDSKGRLHFDEPTQAYSGLDDDEEVMGCDQVPLPRGKRKSLEPTLILNLSTDDDEDSPVKRPGRPRHTPCSIAQESTLAYDDKCASGDADKTKDGNEGGATLGFPVATRAYCAETDSQFDEDERKRDHEHVTTKGPLKENTNTDDEAPTLAFPDFATQAYCPDTGEQSDDDRDSKFKQRTRTTKMQSHSSDDGDASTLAFPDLATQAYCIDTDEQSDEERPHSHAKDSHDDTSVLAFQDLATQAYCADTDDQSYIEKNSDTERKYVRSHTTNGDEESAFAFTDLATQAYCAETDDESDDEATTRSHKSGPTLDPTLKYDMEHNGATTCSRKLGQTLDPTLKYNMALDDEQEAKNEQDDEPLALLCDEPTLAYDTNDDDEPMDTEIPLDEGREDGMLGYTDMPTQPIDQTEESDTMCQPDDTTETEDDTTAATQAYGVDSGGDETPDITEKQVAIDSMDGPRGTTGEEAGPSSVETRKDKVESEDDDFVMATQVYGADDQSETQVPDSQEGAAEDDRPLPGISRISSMLRKVPARSAMASPEKKQQKTLKVAFKEQTPPEECISEEINPTTRRSVRCRKVPVRFQETKARSVTETDAKPTRRRSKDFRMANDGEESLDAPQPTSKSKRKGSQDVVEGFGKAAEQSSEEDTLEIKEVEGMVWRSIGKDEDQEINNNEIETRGKRPARRTSKRQASYKKAVDGHDSDDTESLSSTSSLQQVEVAEITESSVKIHVTVSDGSKREEAMKPRRGRRSNAAKTDKTLQESMPAPAPSGRRQSRRSVVTKNDIADTAQSSKTRSGRGRKAYVPEPEHTEKEVTESHGKLANRRSILEDIKVQVISTEAKEPPASTRRGRRPKSAATPPATGPKQSAITDFAVTVLKDQSPAKSSQETDSLQSTESLSLLQSGVTPAKTTRRTSSTKTDKSETEASPVNQESFVAPEPVKRRGRGRPKAKKKEDEGSIQASTMTPEDETIDQHDSFTRGRGKKTGRKSPVLEAPKTEEPLATPSSSRRGKRAASTPNTPSPSPSKKSKDSDPSKTEGTSPSLRKRSTEIKPKVMFTGVVNKAWEKIVTSLGGELVESVFDCTHLVTDKVRRTVKFLCCLSRGALIVMPTWLEQCQHNKAFIDTTPYLLVDKASEKQYGFTHVISHQRALQGGALSNLSIYVTPGVKPEPGQMKEIIQCAGGKYLSSLPKKPAPSTVVVSCEADEAKCQSAIKAGLQIVSAEFILTGMLRQETRPELYQLFTASLSSDHGNRKKVNDTPAATKRRR